MTQGMNGHGWGMGLGMGWWWIIAILFVVVALLIAYLTRKKSSDHSRDHRKSPLDVLKDRYARGEIDKEEFESRKKDLS